MPDLAAGGHPRSAAAVFSRQRLTILLLGRPSLAFMALAVAFLALVYECADYLLSGAYLDHIEGNVVIASAEYLRGVPFYQLAGGVPHAATYYGPLAYLVEALPLHLGGGVAAGKAMSSLALFVGLVAMAAHLIRRSPVQDACYSLLLLTGGLLLFGLASFWVRPDPFEFLLVAVAVALGGSAWLVGVCIGLAVNFKVHAFVYFLPVLWELWRIGGWRALVRAGVTAGVVFLLPFLAPGISLHDYAVGLAQQIGGRPPSTLELVPILRDTLVLCAPVVLPLLMTQPRVPAAWSYGWASLATVVLLLYPATFPGAGSYHLLPILPVLAEARNRLRPQGNGTEFDLLPLLLIGAMGTTQIWAAIAVTRPWGSIPEEALALAEGSRAQPVEIGYGEVASYGVSQLTRTVLAINGHPAPLDAQWLMELRQIGVDASARWIPGLARCEVGTWLLPRGERPFLTASYYDRRPVFSDKFRRAFAENYRLAATTAHFDVWDCAHEQRAP
jgi:hypothetical protein